MAGFHYHLETIAGKRAGNRNLDEKGFGGFGL
jgi:hypothetical protein